ncbi:MAG: DNA repair protein [Pseudomonadales bacterium]|nr:DNA repair protein [Pseudomonadales bacterium]
MPALRIIALSLIALFLNACQSMYYDAMEQVGYHKRDILVDRVEDVQDAQKDAKQQFSSALEQYQQLIKIQDQDLLDKYNALNDEFEDSKKAAEEVSERINAVQSVSEALFEEWEDELALYSNASLKKQSAQKLAATKKKYNTLIKSMRQAESRMQPVLAALQDQVLYLKHNLNARAIDGLKGELRTIETNVARLIKDMEASIAQSEAFIAELNQDN